MQIIRYEQSKTCDLCFQKYDTFKKIYIFAIYTGALAHLARAFGWQPRGDRFDPDMLHQQYQAFQKWKAF